MKLNSAFMLNSPPVVDYVFGEKRINKIAEITNLQKEVITQQNIDSMDLENIDVIFSTWSMFAPTEEQLDRMKNLKVVFYSAGATDGFCRPFLNRGIKVSSSWLANAIPVAEFCAAQIVLGLKSVYNTTRSLTSSSKWNNSEVGPGCYGKTVTLIGAGAIAQKTKELLEGYNLEVIIIPSRKENRTITLEEAFAKSQVVSNHLPDRDDNVGVLNGKLFELMPEKAFFLNTGRGRQVNEEELIATFKARPDLSALLDVTYPEPPVDSSELYTMPNIYLTPHIAGSLNDEVKRMADYQIEECLRLINSQELQYLVKESMLITS